MMYYKLELDGYDCAEDGALTPDDVVEAIMLATSDDGEASASITRTRKDGDPFGWSRTFCIEAEQRYIGATPYIVYRVKGVGGLRLTNGDMALLLRLREAIDAFNDEMYHMWI